MNILDAAMRASILTATIVICIDVVLFQFGKVLWYSLVREVPILLSKLVDNPLLIVIGILFVLLWIVFYKYGGEMEE